MSKVGLGLESVCYKVQDKALLQEAERVGTKSSRTLNGETVDGSLPCVLPEVFYFSSLLISHGG